MEHVGVGDHDVRPGADGLARVLRRVPVVRERADVPAQRVGERVQLGELVLRQRLRGKEVQRARVRILEDAVEDRQVVAEGLARRGGRDHDRVAPGRRGVVRLALVRVEPAVPAGPRGRRAASGAGRPGSPRTAAACAGIVAQRRQHGLVAQRLLDLEGLQDRDERVSVLTAYDERRAHEPWPPRGAVAPNEGEGGSGRCQVEVRSTRGLRDQVLGAMDPEPQRTRAARAVPEVG